MAMLEQVLAANRSFRGLTRQGEREAASKLPSRNLAILTCMDARLVDFLEPALGIKRGEAKVIKNAGNSVTGTFSATIRSLLISIFELNVKEIMVIGHLDCGMTHVEHDRLVEKMLSRGITAEAIAMIDEELAAWLNRFQNPEENVRDVVDKIRHNPLIPKDVPVHGMLLDPFNGEVKVVVNGANNIIL